MSSSDTVSGGTLWFTLSLVNAGLAQGKGRSGLAWWLLSLLLGPLATLLIVILPAISSQS
jgi:type IV secretory pathway VirB2 component (pilin)